MFHVVEAKFGRLAGRVYDGFFSLTLPTYQDVLDLEEQVRKFELEVPSSLRYQTTNDDKLRPYLAFQVSAARSDMRLYAYVVRLEQDIDLGAWSLAHSHAGPISIRTSRLSRRHGTAELGRTHARQLSQTREDGLHYVRVSPPNQRHP